MDLDRLVQIVQARVGIRDADYRKQIVVTVEQAWQTLAAMGDWWFLDMATPQSFTLTASQRLVTISEKVTNIGRMHHIANSTNRKVWTYKRRADYQAYRTSGNIVDTTYTAQTDESGSVRVFTIRGIDAGKPRIEVDPAPTQAGTYYLHYREAGRVANLDKLPDRWGTVMVELVMSLIAPPITFNQDKWMAIHYRSYEKFLYWLQQMQYYEDTPMDGNEQEMLMDHHIQQQIDTIGDLC